MPKLIGHKTTLHVFRNQKQFEAAKTRLARKGRITEVFVNNRWAFELKLWNRK